jgi:hypothetical protein
MDAAMDTTTKKKVKGIFKDFSFIKKARLAQSVERKTLNLVAVGSIPTQGNF